MAKPVTFWFEFASPYSYLSAMRIEDEAQKHGVDVTWKPFLLGPIFKAQGWETSPFSIYPSKGQNMWRDMERRADRYGLAFKRPDLSQAGTFPQNSLLAARTAIACLDAPWGRDFCRAVFAAAFEQGRNISDPETIAACLQSVAEADQFDLAAAQSNTHKATLRENTEQAQALDIYGAPSFTVDDELFWGDDRLEDALEWAQKV